MKYLRFFHDGRKQEPRTTTKEKNAGEEEGQIIHDEVERTHCAKSNEQGSEATTTHITNVGGGKHKTNNTRKKGASAQESGESKE